MWRLCQQHDNQFRLGFEILQIFNLFSSGQNMKVRKYFSLKNFILIIIFIIIIQEKMVSWRVSKTASKHRLQESQKSQSW